MKFSIFTSLLFHLCCLALLTIHFDICNSYSSKVGCIQSEREALLSFKYNLIDHTNRLSSWNASNPNCCEWVGVVCSHITANVLQLHLNSSPPILDYDYDYYEYEEAVEAYERSMFGGVVNGSLIELKHLTHLDLSGNDFGDMQIPTFFWEMTSLTYLDLSYAGFNGIIPPRIGNLSNLLYLDLSGATLSGTIPSQIGNLTNANISNSLDWLQTLQAIPSLMGIVAFTYDDDQRVSMMEKQQATVASDSEGVINEVLENAGVALGITGLVAKPAANPIN